MFFDEWSGLIRVAVSGLFAYAGIIVVLRISGNCTLSKMNAFDFIVTVALGSILATTLLSRDVLIAEGITAFVVLVGLQFAITWLSVRFKWLSRAITSEPALLIYEGRVLPGQLNKSRVVEREMLAALREHSVGSIDDVGALVLETDGTFSVITRPHAPGPIATLKNVRPSPDV